MDLLEVRTDVKHAGSIRQRMRRYLYICTIAALAGAGGCRPTATTPTEKPQETSATVPADARQLMADVLARYRSAKSYRDQGRLVWQYLDNQVWQETQSDLSTAFVRPDKLALDARGLHLVCDGQDLKARIDDPATANYDGQLLVRAAPKKLGVNDLISDPEMKRFLSDNVVDATPWPLLLLLGDARVDKLLSGDVKFLKDETLDGKTFRRVRTSNADGVLIWWIDAETLVVRRTELADPDASYGVRSFVADYIDAQLDVEIPADVFRLKVPLVSKRVQFFVMPPPTMDLPSPLFGKEVKPFTFTQADGSELTSDALRGNTVVMVWFLNLPESHLTLAQLQRAYELFKDKKGITFLAVSPEAETVATKTIADQLKRLGVEVTLVRDLQAMGRDVFGVPGAPTLVVLDGQRRLQAFKAGADPELGQQLPLLLEELGEGQNPAGQVREMIAEERDRYRKQLAAASVDTATTIVELDEPELAAASQPQRLKLTKLWTNSELKSPGNLLIVQDGDAAPRVLVCDQSEDWRTITELDLEGRIVAKHQLPIPENAAVAQLRTAVDTRGKRFYAGSSRLARQAFVFDENFKLVLAYPQQGQAHDGIGDFALVDFKSDGKLTFCVGFWGVLGIHGVDLGGERLWSNRAATPVVSLAVSSANEAGWRRLLATSDRGDIVAINAFGKNDPPVQVDGHAVTQIYAGNFARTNPTTLMGVALASDSTQIGLALSDELKALWDVPLPAGGHRNQIQWIASGPLLPGAIGQWIFAGPDGSLGIVSSDASFFDTFATGQELTGVAVGRTGDDGLLLISSKKGVTAWQVNRPLGPSN